jgi:hypothetical protein
MNDDVESAIPTYRERCNTEDEFRRAIEYTDQQIALQRHAEAISGTGWPPYGAVVESETVSARRGTSVPPSPDLTAQAVSGPQGRRELALGKASWMYDDELRCHVPVCSGWVADRAGVVTRCGNGPLDEPEVRRGLCSEAVHLFEVRWSEATRSSGRDWIGAF